MAKVKVVMTGGHAATTAIAVVEEIKAKRLDWGLTWIGVKKAIEGKTVQTLESEALPKLGVKFITIITGRALRRFTIHTIPSLLKIPAGFVQSFYHLVKIKPNVVVSFGGFASIPVVVDAKILGIPIIIHEQTSVIGRANGFSSQIADKIALARSESLKYFPRMKSVVIGNPVMKEITKIKPKLKLGNPPTIFITGGSRGSQTINENVEKILRTLLSKYKVIHQTGGLDYLKFSNIKQQLPMALKNNYEVFVRVSPIEISEVFKRSDIVVARAGANTVSELMIIKRPVILIPLSISFMDEQTKNAEIAKTFGIAKIIRQAELTPEVLLKNIDESIRDYSKIVEKVKSKDSPDIGASARLLALIGEYCK